MKKIKILFFLAIIGVMVNPLYQTYKRVTSVNNLITILSLPDKSYDFDVTSSDFNLISNDTAYWILMSFDFPYRLPCLEITELNYCASPAIILVGRSLRDYDDNQDGKKIDRRLYSVIDRLIATGSDVNAYYEGRTALHEAILSRNVELVKKLLAVGADPQLKIDKPRHSTHGFNALELVTQLEKNPVINSPAYTEIKNLLKQHKSG